MPLLRPGLVAAWLLIFIASVRELGVSIFLMGPNSKVIAPAIVNSWLTSSSELSAAMALLQTAMVFIAVAILFSRGAPRGAGRARDDRARVSRSPIWSCATATSPRWTASASTSRRGELVTLLGPSGCGKTTTLARDRRPGTPCGGTIRLNGDAVYSARRTPQRAGREARRVDGVPVLRDLAAHDGVRQCRLRAARAQAAARRGGQPERRARAGPGADAGFRRSPARPSCPAVSSSAWRWRAPSRSRRRGAVRRAAVQPRRQAARRDARGTARAAAPAGYHRRSTSRTTRRRRWRSPTG